MYEIHGLRIRSEIELPGARVVDAAAADLEILGGESRDIGAAPPTGSLLAAVTFADRGGYSVTQTAEGYTIRVFNTCEFEITPDRRQVRAHLGIGRDARLMSLLLTGNVLATLLTLEGEAVLHASAVDVDGRTIAFVGDSGAGKSTLATLFCAAGARLVANDVLRVNESRCFIGALQIRLRGGAASLASEFDVERIERTVDERVSIALDGPDKPAPLAAIIFPRPSRNIEQLRMTELSRSQALYELMRHPRIQGWKSADVIRGQFDAYSRLVGAVPVFVADIPWGPPFDPELPSKVLEPVLAGVTR